MTVQNLLMIFDRPNHIRCLLPAPPEQMFSYKKHKIIWKAAVT